MASPPGLHEAVDYIDGMSTASEACVETTASEARVETTASEARVETTLQEAWTKLQAHWADAREHQAFVDLAFRLNQLPEACRLYRNVQDEPEFASRAEEQLDAITKRAVAMLTSMQRTRQHAPRQRGIQILLWLVVGIALAVVAQRAL